MSEPDRQHPAGPVTPQTPAVSNYGLVLTVYILYLVGFLTGITVLVGVVVAYLQREQYRSSIAIAFPVPNSDVLDWRSVFFYRTSNDSLWNWSLDFAVVGCLDGD